MEENGGAEDLDISFQLPWGTPASRLRQTMAMITCTWKVGGGIKSKRHHEVLHTQKIYFWIQQRGWFLSYLLSGVSLDPHYSLFLFRPLCLKLVAPFEPRLWSNILSLAAPQGAGFIQRWGTMHLGSVLKSPHGWTCSGCPTHGKSVTHTGEDSS